MSVAYATWAYAFGEKGNVRSDIMLSVLRTNKKNIRPFGLKFFLDYFANRNSRVRIIGDVEAEFVARQFLTPSTWIGRVILTSLKIDDDVDHFMSALTDYIGQTFDVVPSFLWVPIRRTREKTPVWNIVKVNGNFKKIEHNKTILNCQYVRLSLNRERRARRLSLSSSSLSSLLVDDVSPPSSPPGGPNFLVEEEGTLS